jgi:hypothetical protein
MCVPAFFIRFENVFLISSWFIMDLTKWLVIKTVFKVPISVFKVPILVFKVPILVFKVPISVFVDNILAG